ncbi:MAG: AAA family ATPase [Bacteroidota bacterium]
MKLVFIVGPPASGKMTVGQALAKLTGLKLFHNHMSIELVRNFFDFGDEGFSALNQKIRWSIFEAVAASDLEGLIFTLVWAFDEVEDHRYVAEIAEIFSQKGADVFYVELVCSLDQRLFRNKQPSRLQAKASKRDVKRSEEVLLKQEKQYRMNSLSGEITLPNYLIIDNTELPPEEVANRIQEAFSI